MTTIFRVATVNILSDLSRWEERREVLRAGLAADLIALQEVRDPLGGGNARWLADAPGGYALRACSQAGRESRREGLAVLSRLPVAGDEVLDLGSQRRVAQLVRVEAGGRPVVVVNGHYRAGGGKRGLNRRQICDLIRGWIAAGGSPRRHRRDWVALKVFSAAAIRVVRVAGVACAQPREGGRPRIRSTIVPPTPPPGLQATPATHFHGDG